MKKRIYLTLIALLFIPVTFAQQIDENDDVELDPINKLAPNNKPVTHDSIAVMTAEEVAITASKKDVRKAKKLLEEQAEVGRLTKELLEDLKFRFEPYYCRYKTEYRSEGFLGIIRCYGGDFFTSLAYIPMNNQEYREYCDYYDVTQSDERSSSREQRFTNFKVENIHESEEYKNALSFDLIINQPVTIDGRTEDHLKFSFTFNYKDGRMACAIEGASRHYARYYGYVTSLR